MMDVQWQGSPGAERIRKRLREHILAAGWPEQDAVGLAIDPEIDAWLWTGTDHSSRALGWSTMEALGSSLQQAGHLQQGSSKPACPKEAAEWALRQVRKPRSSTVYAAVSCRVSLARCSDPALRLLVDTLRRWFPDAAAGVETCWARGQRSTKALDPPGRARFKPAPAGSRDAGIAVVERLSCRPTRA